MNRRPVDKLLVVSAIVLLVCSNLILRLPLFNYLGYEFSVAVALIVPFLNWILIGHFVRNKFISRDERTIPQLRTLAASAQWWGLLLLMIPLLSSTFNLLFTKNCSYVEGFFFYVLIPIVSSIWTTGLALFCVVVFRRPLLWYAGILIVCFLYPLALGYYYPQIYSYNFVYGYFPGFSYDETMSISRTLLLFRGVTIVLGLLFYLLAEAVLWRRAAGKDREGSSAASRTAAIAVLSIAILLSWWFRTDLGFESPSASIQRMLGASITTEHFTIYYSKDAFTDEEIRYAAAMHEFRFEQVQSALQAHAVQHIDSYLYPDADVKRKVIGTGNTNIAKPWKQEVHLNKDSWEGTLKHELVHALAGEFGMPVIRAHYNTGLVEGLAMAVDEDFGNRTLHEYAAAMVKFEIIKDPARLVQPVGFATQSSSVSYVMMGSFIRYLIDRYGVAKFKGVYGGKSPQAIYGVSYEQLTDQWLHFISSIEVPESSRRHVGFYFRRPSIFARECAHAVANRNEEGRRQLERNSPVAAIGQFQEALAMSWNSESFAGLVRSNFAAARYDSVIGLMDTQLEDTLRRTSVINLYLPYGDALWYRGDYVAARKVDAELASYDLAEWLDESAALRSIILQNQRLRAALADYVVGSLSDSSALNLLDTLEMKTSEPIIRYLRAKLYLRERRFHDAVTQFESIHMRFDSTILNVRLEQLLGEAYFYLHDYGSARAHFHRSLNEITNTSYVNRLKDWIERCTWFEQHGAGYLIR